MFHKEGFKIIAITFLLVALFAVVVDKFVVSAMVTIPLFFTLFVFLFLILQFFRNPKRTQS